MISKKLIANIYYDNSDEGYIRTLSIEGDEVVHSTWSDMHLNIRTNIHELSHLCKVWAKANYADLIIYATSVSLLHSFNVSSSCPDPWESRCSFLVNKSFDADSEPLAIFAACEYILKELNDKDSN